MIFFYIDEYDIEKLPKHSPSGLLALSLQMHKNSYQKINVIANLNYMFLWQSATYHRTQLIKKNTLYQNKNILNPLTSHFPTNIPQNYPTTILQLDFYHEVVLQQSTPLTIKTPANWGRTSPKNCKKEVAVNHNNSSRGIDHFSVLFPTLSSKHRGLNFGPY